MKSYLPFDAILKDNISLKPLNHDFPKLKDEFIKRDNYLDDFHKQPYVGRDPGRMDMGCTLHKNIMP